MWGTLVLTTLLAIGGFYFISGEQRLQVTQQAVDRAMAENMALYRQAVLHYFSLHPSQYTTVTIPVLMQEQLMPNWMIFPVQSDWTNARAADGSVYIYAKHTVSPSVVSEVLRLSQQSILVGVYRRGDIRLYSPLFADTGITLDATVTASIPDGSPLWLAKPT